MNFLHKIADVLGYDLVKTRKNILLHRHLRNLFALLKIDCVLDVGANHGQYGLMLRNLGYQGKIVSFEPVAASYALLSKTARRDADWQACNFALGAFDGDMEINVPESSDFASFLPPSGYSREIFDKTIAMASKERVQIKKLDTVLGTLIDVHRHHGIHLKMDTQGYDLEVFKGAAQSLQHISTLQSEISVLPIYEGMPDYLESLAKYRRSGFEVTGMFPVSHDSATLMVIEFDCVLRRKKNISIP